MECENSAYARDGKMESPGGVATVPAGRVGVIHAEMVAQMRSGVKAIRLWIQLTVRPMGLQLRPGTSISPNTRRILWTPDRLAGHAGSCHDPRG
jgi:hypothetical protein